MSTDTAPLRRGAQNYAIYFDLGTARAFEVMPVNDDGTDGTPPAADPRSPVPLIEAFDGVSDVGTITGSIDRGGFSCELTVPKVAATFDDWFQADLRIKTWHGGVPGVVGAAGIDPDDILLFRGYMRDVTSGRPAYGKHEARFGVESSSAYLRENSLGPGFDWASDTPHGAPGDNHAILRHIVLDHTNITPRSDFGIYLPLHSLDRYTFNGGNIMEGLRGIAKNFSADEGWVFCRREDDLYVGCHPNIWPELHPNVDSPIIDLDADLLLSISVPETLPDRQVSVRGLAQLSDGTEYASPVETFGTGALSTREQFRVRTDDTAMVDTLTQRKAAHLARRYRAVKVETGIMVAVDLGDVVTLTIDLPQRGIAWSQKKFVTTAVEWRPDIQKRTFRSTLTLDEVVTP